MDLKITLEAISRIESRIADLYEIMGQALGQDSPVQALWADLARDRRRHARLLEEVQEIMPPASPEEIPGNPEQYQRILQGLEALYKAVSQSPPSLDQAFRLAFHLETLSIHNVFNELIKLPREPYFEILSEVHLSIRRHMGQLIRGIEAYSQDPELRAQVARIKERVIERRSGEDRRTCPGPYIGPERRRGERRKGTLVKILVWEEGLPPGGWPPFIG